jgi:hypothetical protein
MPRNITYRLRRLEVHGCDHCNLACVGCNHSSPHLAKRFYGPEDYAPWLDRLAALGVGAGVVCVSGGEPFLNPRLADLAEALRRWTPGNVAVYTNLFWLTGPEAIDRHARVFEHINTLSYTLYRPVVDRVGRPQLESLLAAIRKRWGTETRPAPGDVATTFYQVGFTEEPEPVRELGCVVRTCTQLTAEGLLYRCPYGHALRGHPLMTEGFRRAAAGDLVFDLRGPTDVASLAAWAEKWPLDTCRYCTLGQGKQVPTPWVSDGAIRGMGAEEYRGRLVQLGGLPGGH